MTSGARTWRATRASTPRLNAIATPVRCRQPWPRSLKPTPCTRGSTCAPAWASPRKKYSILTISRTTPITGNGGCCAPWHIPVKGYTTTSDTRSTTRQPPSRTPGPRPISVRTTEQPGYPLGTTVATSNRSTTRPVEEFGNEFGNERRSLPDPRSADNNAVAERSIPRYHCLPTGGRAHRADRVTTHPVREGPAVSRRHFLGLPRLQRCRPGHPVVDLVLPRSRRRSRNGRLDRAPKLVRWPAGFDRVQLPRLRRPGDRLPPTRHRHCPGDTDLQLRPDLRLVPRRGTQPRLDTDLVRSAGSHRPTGQVARCRVPQPGDASHSG